MNELIYSQFDVKLKRLMGILIYDNLLNKITVTQQKKKLHKYIKKISLKFQRKNPSGHKYQCILLAVGTCFLQLLLLFIFDMDQMQQLCAAI